LFVFPKETTRKGNETYQTQKNRRVAKLRAQRSKQRAKNFSDNLDSKYKKMPQIGAQKGGNLLRFKNPSASEFLQLGGNGRDAVSLSSCYHLACMVKLFENVEYSAYIPPKILPKIFFIRTMPNYPLLLLLYQSWLEKRLTSNAKGPFLLD